MKQVSAVSRPQPKTYSLAVACCIRASQYAPTNYAHIVRSHVRPHPPRERASHPEKLRALEALIHRGAHTVACD